MRWIVAQKNRVRNGELYRFIADSKGAFVQVRLQHGLLTVFCLVYVVCVGVCGVCWGEHPSL